MRLQDYMYQVYSRWSPKTWWTVFNKNLIHDLVRSIRIHRKIIGVSQKELALRIGSQQPTISRLEQGRDNISLAFLRKVANALGMVVLVDVVPLKEAIRREIAAVAPRKFTVSISSVGTATSYFSVNLMTV